MPAVSGASASQTKTATGDFYHFLRDASGDVIDDTSGDPLTDGNSPLVSCTGESASGTGNFGLAFGDGRMLAFGPDTGLGFSLSSWTGKTAAQ